MSITDLPFVFVTKALFYPVAVVIALIACLTFWDISYSAPYFQLSIVVFLLSTIIFDTLQLNNKNARQSWVADAFELLLRWALILVILWMISYPAGMDYMVDDVGVVSWIWITPIILLAGKCLVKYVVYQHAMRFCHAKKAVIVGMNSVGIELAERIKNDPLSRILVMSYFDERDCKRLPKTTGEYGLESLSNIASYVVSNEINVVYIALPMARQPRILHLLDLLKDSTASIYFVPDLFITDLMHARFDKVNGMPIVAVRETPFYGLHGIVKRCSDCVIAFLVLLIIWPIMLAISIGIKFTSPGPVLFCQRRYGLDGKEIVIYKFRSMGVCEDGQKVNQATVNDPRVTTFGSFLRKTSLDELPQFINVLQGRMSIVGPRPHAVSHNELYRKLIKGYMIRHKVKPGITGWAQVNGLRGETETTEKMAARIEYDLNYLRNWSLWFDLLIMIKTIGVVFGDRHAY